MEIFRRNDDDGDDDKNDDDDDVLFKLDIILSIFFTLTSCTRKFC